MDEIILPNHLDDSRYLLIWTIDEWVVLSTCMGIGVTIRQIIIMCVLGVLMLYMYRRFAAGRPDGFVTHALYYNCGVPLKGHCVINPFQRRILR